MAAESFLTDSGVRLCRKQKYSFALGNNIFHWLAYLDELTIAVKWHGRGAQDEHDGRDAGCDLHGDMVG
ncbi:hypothetical protein PG996_007725 [Apiospora saccharicola]|uniref:Uncharacterized protein n=1 Tax=Apiospora saccharicola TaxID=335842 RepID=A0ABR1VFE3_9PEZI